MSVFSLLANINTPVHQELVHVQLVGDKAGDRKMSVLDHADSAAIVGLSHGSGKVGKAAQGLKAETEVMAVAASIALGNFNAFAQIVAGMLGEAVKFGVKDRDGKVVRKASEDFALFGGVLKHKLLQLEDKGKIYSSSGKITSAASDLFYLIGLHEKASGLIAERKAADDERRAKLAAEREADVQGEKGVTDGTVIDA